MANAMQVPVVLTERIKRVFATQSLAMQIYTVCFVLVFASGNSILHDCVVYLMTIMLFAQVFDVLDRHDRQTVQTMFFRKRLSAGTIVLFLIVLYLAFQTTMAYMPNIASIYSIRYALYACLTLFAVRPAVLASCIRLTLLYLNLAAVTVIADSLLTGSRGGGLLGDYQAAGMMMSIACVLNALNYYRDRTSGKSLVLFLLTTTALLLTGKRTFTMIALGAIVVLALVVRRREGGSFARLLVASLLIVFVVVVSYVTIDPVRNAVERFALLTSDDNFEMMSGRNLLWEAAWRVFLNNPMFGIGFGSFPDYYGDYMVERGAAYLTHSIYFGMLAETGVVGTFLFCSLFVWGVARTLKELFALRRLRWGERSCEYVLLVSLCLQGWFLVYGLTGNGIYDANEMFFYVVALVMVQSVSSLAKMDGTFDFAKKVTSFE